MAVLGYHKRVDVVAVGGSGVCRTGAQTRAAPGAMMGGSRVCVTGAQTRAALEGGERKIDSFLLLPPYYLLLGVIHFN